MKDAEIVELYWQRDEKAIQETTQKYGAYLSKIAYNILSNLEYSKECVNDTYLAAWNSMPENRPSILSTYLGKITRQISIDRFRKNNSKSVFLQSMLCRSLKWRIVLQTIALRNKSLMPNCLRVPLILSFAHFPMTLARYSSEDTISSIR